jgi:hypothetical protein
MSATDLKSNDEAMDILENEGTGYAVQDYISASAFEDPKTRELWQAAGDALSALERHVQTATGREFD